MKIFGRSNLPGFAFSAKNIDLLQLPTTGFLCSRTTSSRAILRVLDWALAISKDPDACVMSTYHSPLEAEALKFLLRGKCKIILVLGRSLYKKIPADLQPAIDEGRLLILSITEQPRISTESARKCNEYITTTASTLVFGFISKNSSLNELKEQAAANGKRVEILATVDENR